MNQLVTERDKNSNTYLQTLDQAQLSHRDRFKIDKREGPGTDQKQDFHIDYNFNDESINKID